MDILVVTGSGRSPAWVRDACADWARRIHRTFPIQIVETSPRLTGRARIVALDERGEERTSEAFAELLESAVRAGAHPLVFVIGGPYGLDDAVKSAAWKTLRLSTLVLNHAVARVVLVEQIYRACAIRSGGPYHHGD
ncbi:MAG: 23S rRNA (pseudouridine(1915)-N(3))-methyltransferase RlmH [Myxococcales bacterium]|nr:23S rRNA (pseudouridine(1915)-N(3))-methyltransferase RlmH [Myxococcales bacterium]